MKPKNSTALKQWCAPDPMAPPIAPTSAILTSVGADKHHLIFFLIFSFKSSFKRRSGGQGDVDSTDHSASRKAAVWLLGQSSRSWIWGIRSVHSPEGTQHVLAGPLPA